MAAKTNEITRQKSTAWTIFIRQFKNPLLLVFIISTVVAYALGQNVEATAIWIVMSISIILGFWNEYRAAKTVNDLIKRISFTVTVVRDGVEKTIPVKDVQLNDEVLIHPGSIIPADLKLKTSEGLEVNESVLTGESLPAAKVDGDEVYMGTVATGGNAHGIVMAIGMDTKFGKISQSAGGARPETEFQKGLRGFSNFLAKIAIVTVLLIIVLGALLHHPIVETILFSLTVAMGITPELLPLIVTISLSYGSKKLAKKNVIVKEFVSIEDLGNMEVLCTDKTGTLTEGKILVNSFKNMKGEEDKKVIELAMICNSGFPHGHAVMQDSIDKAILDFAKEKNVEIEDKPKKISEVPFNFENRFMSMVVDWRGKKMAIYKGSPEAILAKCKMDSKERSKAEKSVTDLQKGGFRVIGLATGDADLKNLKYEGFVTFSDVPKKDLKEVFDQFESLGVKIKIITGDNENVAEKVSREADFNYKKVLVGPDIEKISDSELPKVAWETDIFARVTPSQKTRIIAALNKGGHTVGYLGDGINDAPALHAADVGISVNTGVDVAKDAASIVLLHKSLGVIADGIREGRIIFGNTIKYVLMGTSSDFGNMVSAAAASVFLPFLPMTPVQFLVTDILYDTSQLAIPSDNVDNDQLLRPKSWDIKYIKKFMWVFGPISTIYDFLTFGAMYYIFHARGGMFQTGWFIESLITEILVVFVIRTRKIPFFRSLPSIPLVATCMAVIVVAVYLPISPLAKFLDFKPMPMIFFVFLIGLTFTYLILVEIGKFFLNKERFG